MKLKNLEKEMERQFVSCLGEFTNLLTLYEAYIEKASDKRQDKFTDKIEKKYGKELDKLEGRIDKLEGRIDIL